MADDIVFLGIDHAWDQLHEVEVRPPPGPQQIFTADFLRRNNDGTTSTVQLGFESAEQRDLFVQDWLDLRRLLRLLINQIRNGETNKYGVLKHFVDLENMIHFGHTFVVRWGVIYGFEYVSPKIMRWVMEFEAHLGRPMTSLHEFTIGSDLVQGYIGDFFGEFNADPQTSLLENFPWFDFSRNLDDDDASFASDDSDASEDSGVSGIGEDLFSHFEAEVVE